MEKEYLVDEAKCKTWEECLEWADTSLRDRNRMKVEDDRDIVRDVAEDLADDLGIEADEE
jgi:hypothetical protein